MMRTKRLNFTSVKIFTIFKFVTVILNSRQNLRKLMEQFLLMLLSIDWLILLLLTVFRMEENLF